MPSAGAPGALSAAAAEAPRVAESSLLLRAIKLIDTDRHTIVESAHPSPLSADNGFFGSRPFSQINRALRDAGEPEVDWQIPDL